MTTLTVAAAPGDGVRAEALEELALNAWPSLEQALADGWLLRAANGYTRRANSVQPLYDGWRSLYQKILAAERWYGKRDLPPMFRLTAGSRPAELDGVLADRGYRREAPTSVQWLSLDGPFCESPLCEPLTDGPWEVRAAPDAKWFAAYTAVQEMSGRDAEVLEKLLQVDAGDRFFGLATAADGSPAGVGIAVQEEAWVGLFGLATAPEQRGRGFCTGLIGRLLARARERGARRAYLQVGVSNDPALRLYAKLGFREAYRYWYRIAPDA